MTEARWVVKYFYRHHVRRAKGDNFNEIFHFSWLIGLKMKKWRTNSYCNICLLKYFTIQMITNAFWKVFPNETSNLHWETTQLSPLVKYFRSKNSRYWRLKYFQIRGTNLGICCILMSKLVSNIIRTVLATLNSLLLAQDLQWGTSRCNKSNEPDTSSRDI